MGLDVEAYIMLLDLERAGGAGGKRVTLWLFIGQSLQYLGRLNTSVFEGVFGLANMAIV
jgi:hypothetical protein